MSIHHIINYWREKMKLKKKQIMLKKLEKTLWSSAVKLRGSVDPSRYKDIVLGIIFLKYASDMFEERRKELMALSKNPESDYYCETEDELIELLEDREEYISENVFYVPEKSRWGYLIKHAKKADIAKSIPFPFFTYSLTNSEL